MPESLKIWHLYGYFAAMKVKIDNDIRTSWNDELIRGDIRLIHESQSSDQDISMDKIRRAFKSDTCDEDVFNLINKFFHRRKMKIAKSKNKFIQPSN